MQHACWELGAAESLAYPPVIASGANATFVDYTQSLAELSVGSLVMVDAGAEYGGIYPTDCTRCWPCQGGSFTSGQRRLYEAVLRVQRCIISQICVGSSCVDLQKRTVELLTGELAALGVLRSDGPPEAMRRLTRVFFPHDFGHYCGLDIHELGPATVPERSMITVEPGLYMPLSVEELTRRCKSRGGAEDDIAAALKELPEDLRGVGVRIEDSLVVLPRAEPERANCLHGVLDAVEHFDRGGLIRHASPSSSVSPRRTAQELLLRQQEVCRSGSSLAHRTVAHDASLYPFPTLVTTAFAEKDVDAISSLPLVQGE